MYVAEALRGQLARASAARTASAGPAVPAVDHAKLLKSLKELVEEAVAKKAAEGAFTLAAGEPDSVATSLATSLEIPVGLGSTSERRVQGQKGSQAAGPVHDVFLHDPAILKDAWVTSCGWRFGHSEHLVSALGDATCAACMARRITARRREEGRHKFSLAG